MVMATSPPSGCSCLYRLAARGFVVAMAAVWVAILAVLAFVFARRV